MLQYARAAEGGTGEEERRRDEGTGDKAKEAARAADGTAAEAWVIGGRGGRRRDMEERMRWRGLALWREGKDIDNTKCPWLRAAGTVHSIIIIPVPIP